MFDVLADNESHYRDFPVKSLFVSSAAKTLKRKHVAIEEDDDDDDEDDTDTLSEDDSISNDEYFDYSVCRVGKIYKIKKTNETTKQQHGRSSAHSSSRSPSVGGL